MPRPILFYDEACKFCRCSAQLAYAIDRRHQLAILRFSDARFEPSVAHLPEAARRSQSHVVYPDGRVLSGGDGILVALGTAPIVGIVFRTMLRFGATRAFTGIAYRFVAKHRWRLARLIKDVPGPLVEP